MSATYGKEIKYGGPGGQEVTDPSFYYDQATQTLYVENLAAGDLVFSGETIVSPTYTGAIVLGTAGSDTVDVTATLTFNTAPTLATNTKLYFRDTGLFIYSSTDGKLTISSDGSGADDIIMAGTVTFNNAVQNDSTITVGVDGTGYDVKFYSATASSYWLWDESADKMIVAGASQFSGAIIVGIDDTGYDVTFFGATTGKYFKWDQVNDDLELVGTFTQTGNADITGTTTITSASASALTVGRLGATTPALKVDASTATSITGVQIKSAASAGGVAVKAIGETNVAMTVDGAGTGTLGLNTVATNSGLVTIGNSTSVAGVLVYGPSTVTSASATSFAVGRLGATTPAFVVDSSTGTQAAGLKVVGATTTGTVAVVTVGGASVNLTIDATGTGTIGIGATSTGRVTITPVTTITGLLTLTAGVTGPMTVTSNSASSLAVGRLGATTPAFSVDSATGSQTAGFKVTGAALNGTVALVVTDTSGNTNLTINALGSGTIGIGSVSTGIVTITPACTITGALTNTGATYANGGVDRSTAAALAIGATNATSVVITPATTITGALTLTAGIAAKVIYTSTETIAAGGTTTALDLTKYHHDIDADAGGDIFTLADGVQGQEVVVVLKTATGIATITPATMHGGTSVTIAAAGASVRLRFQTTLGWAVIGGNAFTII